MARLDRDVERLETSMNSLLKLLGGNATERARYFEILKGITTPAEYRLAKSGLVSAERDLTTVKNSLTAMKKAAAETRAG